MFVGKPVFPLLLYPFPTLLGTSYHNAYKILLQEPFQLPLSRHLTVALCPGVALKGFNDPINVLQ